MSLEDTLEIETDFQILQTRSSQFQHLPTSEPTPKKTGKPQHVKMRSNVTITRTATKTLGLQCTVSVVCAPDFQSSTP